MNDLKRVWKNIRKCYRGEREIVQNDAFGWKVSSRQFDEIMRFLVDNTHQENDYVISIITEVLNEMMKKMMLRKKLLLNQLVGDL